MQTHSKPTPYFPQDIENYAPWVAKHGLTAPYGECQCGQCHQPAPIAGGTARYYGWLKGHPKRFIHNHHAIGRHSNNHVFLPISERFWAKVTVAGPDECWLWKGPFNAYGYGILSDTRQRRPMAHRISWEVHFGPIPKGMHICHHCDNPPCVNPNHLFLGTNSDNRADQTAKGRTRRGSAHPAAKITEDDVREIRKLRAQRMRYKTIAKRFGITHDNVWLIVHLRAWKHVK